MKLQYENIGLVDGDAIIAELLEWQQELDSSRLWDDQAVYSALDTVIDIIVDNMEA